MNTCDGCRHFGPSEKREAPFGSCNRWKTGYRDYDLLEENECQVEDDEWWAMIVAHKFGCVLHEPKD